MLQPASSTPGLLECREVSTGTTGADTVRFQCNGLLCQVRTSVPENTVFGKRKRWNRCGLKPLKLGVSSHRWSCWAFTP